MLVIPCCSSKRRFFKMLACCSDFKRRKFALLRPFLTLYISNFDFPKYLVVYFEICSSISNHSSTICALKSKTKTTKTGRRLLNVYLPAHPPSKLLSFIFFPASVLIIYLPSCCRRCCCCCGYKQQNASQFLLHFIFLRMAMIIMISWSKPIQFIYTLVCSVKTQLKKKKRNETYFSPWPSNAVLIKNKLK